MRSLFREVLQIPLPPEDQSRLKRAEQAHVEAEAEMLKPIAKPAKSVPSSKSSQE